MAAPPVPNWQAQILKGVGAPVTPQNLLFINSWAKAEGGGAQNNPFNTTQHAPGASSYNQVGVRNYVSPEQGIQATIQTLRNGRYGNIIAALRKGDNAKAAASALAASPWGTGSLVEKMLGGGAPVPAPNPTMPAAGPVPAAAGAPAAPPLLRGLPSPLAMAVNTGNQMFGLPPLPAQLLNPVAPVAAPTLNTPPAARTLPAPLGGGVGQGAARFAVLAPGADRQGVAIQPAVLNFVGRIGQLAGHPLTIGTGTNHNEFVQGTHRESDHWTGYAADIPASGAALTRLGQTALVAAGADPAWAAKQTGGLYNIGGKQIIFNSMEGGNHYNHLHVGIRTR